MSDGCRSANVRMYAQPPGPSPMTVQAVGPSILRGAGGPVVLSLEELAAPRAASPDLASAQLEAGAVESSESGAMTAGRLAGLLGSGTFAVWTSLTCFVC